MLFCCSVTYAGDGQLHFKHLTINDGLSLSSVYYIFQDSKGYMWFATEDGLNKYDGKNFTIYNHSHENHNSLTYKWIEKIIEDKNGRLWLSSRNGLSCLDPSNDKILRYLQSEKKEFKLTNDTVIDILEAGDYIFVGTRKGVNKIHTTTLESEEIVLKCKGDCQTVNTLYKDDQDRVWIGSCGGLLLCYPEKKEAFCVSTYLSNNKVLQVNCIFQQGKDLWIGHQSGFLKYMLNDNSKHELNDPINQFNTSSPVNNISIDTKGRIWIQSEKGLSLLENNSLVSIINAEDPTPSLALNPVKPLFEDKKGCLWYGTFGDGIYLIYPDKRKTMQITHNPINTNGLSDNTINCIYEDRSGGIWIGTFGSGISIFDPESNLIPTLRHNPSDPESMSSSFVWSIFESKDGKIWIGTNETGISIYDPEKKHYSSFIHHPNDETSIPPGAIRDIFQSSKGTMWIGTDGEGLLKLNPRNGKYIQYKNALNDPASISHNSVRTIYEDSTGILWVGTRGGLNSFNPSTGKFKRYLHNPENKSSISNNFVYSAIYMDKQGFLWVGTYGGGLNRLDTKTGRFTHFMYDEDDPNAISDNIVFSIYEDEKGYFWIGTNSGLNLFNPSTGKFKRYGLDSGLPNEVIYGIMPDDANRLWMTTNKGISRLDLTNFNFKNFDVNDGLQSNEFNGGAFHRGASGKLYAGGVYGLNIFSPEDIVPEENKAELVISRMEIMGKDVKVMNENFSIDSTKFEDELVELVDNYYLSKHVGYLDVVRLNYKQRFFSIEYAALNHLKPEKLQFRYRMKNLEEHWYPAGNRNYVTFANMKPGSYIFEVQAINSDGNYTQNPARLKIIITPPFWRSYWFILLEVLLITLIIVFIYRYLLNQKTNRLLKDQYEQIKIAHQQLQISENNLKELNATKDKFFSIISHDLKNPFASVLSISELLNNNYEAIEGDELKYGVQKIYSTNKHIYNLLENLLTWSKTQRGNLTVQKNKFNLSNTIDTTVNILKLSAEKKEIFIINECQENLCAIADREMISTVFRNLLNNAVKFTPQGKEIIIKSKVQNGSVKISVQDQGIGISPENQERLFKIDDKFKSDGTDGEKGTGLGLIICKEFIEKNNGKIEVFSRPNEGSKFSFTIPAG